MKKKLILTVVFILLITHKGKAQMPVTDVAAEAQLTHLNSATWKNYLKNTAILKKTVATIETLEGMQDTYDEWSEAVREVNSYISSGKEIIAIGDKVTKIAKTYDDAFELIVNEDILDAKQKEIYLTVFSKLLDQSLTQFDNSINITSNGVFEMNDSERLSFITDIHEKVNLSYDLTLYAYNKLKYSIDTAKKKYRSTQILKEAATSVRQ